MPAPFPITLLVFRRPHSQPLRAFVSVHLPVVCVSQTALSDLQHASAHSCLGLLLSCLIFYSRTPSCFPSSSLQKIFLVPTWGGVTRIGLHPAFASEPPGLAIACLRSLYGPTSTQFVLCVRGLGPQAPQDRGDAHQPGIQGVTTEYLCTPPPPTKIYMLKPNP